MTSLSGQPCMHRLLPLASSGPFYSRHHHRLLLYLLLVLSWKTTVLTGAKGVSVHNVTVPTPGIAGEAARLECHWSPGSKGFYSVRWYKDGEQFYSFIPRNRPEVKVDHNLPGVTVFLSESNEYVVTLRKIDLASQGIYRCEVMSEAPTFQTSFASANLTVVDVPEAPQLTGLQDKYTVGDTLHVNCTARDSHPAARITFRVNGSFIHPSSGRVTEFPTEGGVASGNPYALSTTSSQLSLPLGEHHVPAVTVLCRAEVLSVARANSTTVRVEPRSSAFSFFNAGVPRCCPGLLLVLALSALTNSLSTC